MPSRSIGCVGAWEGAFVLIDVPRPHARERPEDWNRKVLGIAASDERMEASMADHDEERIAVPPREHHRVADTGRTLRGVLAGLIIAALVALGIDNRREVRVGWVFGEGDAQLWLVLVLAVLAGALIGWLVTHRPHLRSSR